MWIGNIGKKSAAFINHKPFHPGNYQNQEKVWLAEQKQKEEQKKEKELEERRREEVKIEELRRALRGEAQAALQLQKKEEAISPAEELRRKAKEAARQQALQRKQQEAQQRLRQPAKSTLYQEDVLVLGHTSVFGSLYCKQEKKWGYRCCGCLDKSVACSASPVGEESRNKKRKNRINAPPQDVECTSSPSPREVAETKEDKQADKGSKHNGAASSNGDIGNNYLVGPSKRRAREGGVAAYLKLMELPEEGD